MAHQWGILTEKLLEGSASPPHPHGATVAQRQTRRGLLFGAQPAGGVLRAGGADGALLVSRLQEQLWEAPWARERMLLALQAWHSLTKISFGNRQVGLYIQDQIRFSP